MMIAKKLAKILAKPCFSKKLASGNSKYANKTPNERGAR